VAGLQTATAISTAVLLIAAALARFIEPHPHARAPSDAPASQRSST
jgi:MFS transporter, DHA2 family, methylenomycin A resistance protein